jgi:hypothetical protein
MSVNIRQHKAEKNMFTRQRSKTKQKSKQSFTGVNESIIPGHHAQGNKYMHKASTNDT